jgi:UDP-glucose 4-epimerase
MKIAIFGGGGFIGSTITDSLLLAGHTVKVFERPRVPPYRNFAADENVTWLTGDYLNSNDVREAISGCDAVVHLISSTLPKNSNDDPIYDVQTNVVPTIQLLNEMVKSEIKKIVFISSGGTVYGSTECETITENHPLQPQVSYGITKLAIEKYLYLYKRIHGLCPVILRVSNPYGERQRVNLAQGAAAVFLSKVIKNEAIEIWGDGSVVRDYIHVSDVAAAFIAALAYNGNDYIFNIGSGVGTSLNQLLDSIEHVTMQKVDRKYLPNRSIDVNRNVLNIELAKRELQWTPEIGLVDGLARTFNWMKMDNNK